MIPDPVILEAGATLQDAARAMREDDVGDVIVRDESRVCGVLTDRDVVVRAVAEGRDPAATTIGEICSQELEALSPEDSVDEAVNLVRHAAIRRIPVLEDGAAVGVVSLGDLALERDPESALADVSAAPANE